MKKILNKISILIVSILFAFTSITNLNASSTSISISTSSSTILVGKTFTVTIKISSSSALGSWQFTPSYDSSKLKLVSGESPVVGYASNSSTKSKSYTYSFKALSSGDAKITVKSYGAYDYNEKSMSISAGSKKVSIITQSQLQA